MNQLRDLGVVAGKSLPLGAMCQPDGVNFSVYSKNATAVDLPLFHRAGDAQPARTISLDPAQNRTYFYWHVFVPGVQAGQTYGDRVTGPFDPGMRLSFRSHETCLPSASREYPRRMQCCF
jgi:glycogen operon protein